MNKLETTQNKIADHEKLRSILALWRFQDKKIVFTNGCFDILHLGHVDYLSKAADLGDVLVLGLNTDASVSRIKGPSRPVLDQHARATLLASLHFVTLVVLFDEPTPYELIQIVQPDILVKGKDYKAEDVVGYDIVTAKGGRVETIDLVEGYSTSAIISKILKTPPQGL
jgi:D-glycero-beta-D-manno-heptose 1-phosphate adenylyltransferase